MFTRNQRLINYITAGALALATASPALAQVEQQRPAPRPQVEQQQTPQFVTIDSNARETRERFKEVLGVYPPALGRVLKLDPTLMTNDAYLSTYPALATFLKQNPQIARNPGYFLEHVWISQDDYNRQPESAAIRVWNNLMEGLMIIGVISLIAFVLTWLIRTVIDYRRWSRLSKVQAEVNNKLFDRFSSNEDLLTYIQSPAGRRFLEAAPIVSSPQSFRPMGAPTSRILFSVQAGIIIGITALGILFISGRVIEEVAQPLFAIATIGISLGIGFVVSSAAAYVLSRNMGLIEPPPPAGGGTPESNR